MTKTYSLIDEELKRTNGNISKVARALGLDYHALRERQARSRLGQKLGVHPAVGPEPSDISTLGRMGYEPNVIAVKRQGDTWPTKYADVLAAARVSFDAGTHEMFQTSDNGWVVQYLIPRLRPAGKRNFFSNMEYAF
ncbi:helix-turn-helix domain-containing protein [Rhizobium arsenicireducens]